MAQAVDQEQLGPGDGRGGRPTPGRVHHPVGRPVHDQRRDPERTQARPAVLLGQDRDHLAQHAAGRETYLTRLDILLAGGFLIGRTTPGIDNLANRYRERLASGPESDTTSSRLD